MTSRVGSAQLAPQARPILAWFEAVKRGDREQLESVFSVRMRERFEKMGWEEAMREYQAVFKHFLGDYHLDAFAFSFTGGEQEGKVAVVYEDKEYRGLRVIKEEADWKVNER